MIVYLYAYLSTLAVFLPCDMVWLGTMASRLYRPTLGNILLSDANLPAADRLAAADRQSALFGVNRAALYSFHEADHGERDGSPLRAYVQRCAAEQGIDLNGGRVLLLCYPRLLGYTFNPLSVYFCHRADGELALMIYEVRSTFGDIHAYALPVKPDQLCAAGVRQQHEKLFYVSPFIEMAMR